MVAVPIGVLVLVGVFVSGSGVTVGVGGAGVLVFVGGALQATARVVEVAWMAVSPSPAICATKSRTLALPLETLVLQVAPKPQ